VIASDFVEHIIQRVARIRENDGEEGDGGQQNEARAKTASLAVRRDAEALLTMCSAHHSFTSLPPSLVAAAAVLTTLQPDLDERLEEVLETVEHFSQIDKVCLSILSSLTNVSIRIVTFSVDRRNTSHSKTTTQYSFFTTSLLPFNFFALQVCIREAMSKIETLVQASLPPSPLPSPRGSRRRLEDSAKEDSSGGAQVITSTTTSVEQHEEETTPTKILDVAKTH